MSTVYHFHSSLPPLAPPMPCSLPLKFMTLIPPYSPYYLLSLFSAALVYMFRPDYYELYNLSGGSSLDYTGSPFLCSHWLPVALHFKVGPWEVSPTTLACQVVLPLCWAYLDNFFFIKVSWVQHSGPPKCSLSFMCTDCIVCELHLSVGIRISI